MLSFRPCSKTSLDDLTWGAVSAGVAGLWNALLIGAVLYCLTPVAQYLPLNALAAIVIVGVVNVMDFGHLLYLARVCAKYFAVLLSSCTAAEASTITHGHPAHVCSASRLSRPVLMSPILL